MDANPANRHPSKNRIQKTTRRNGFSVDIPRCHSHECQFIDEKNGKIKQKLVFTLTPATVATRISCGLRGSTHSSFIPVLNPTGDRGLKARGGTAVAPVLAR